MVMGNWLALGAVHSVCTDMAKVVSLLSGGMWYRRMACQDRKKLAGREQHVLCWLVSLSSVWLLFAVLHWCKRKLCGVSGSSVSALLLVVFTGLLGEELLLCLGEYNPDFIWGIVIPYCWVPATLPALKPRFLQVTAAVCFHSCLSSKVRGPLTFEAFPQTDLFSLAGLTCRKRHPWPCTCTV